MTEQGKRETREKRPGFKFCVCCNTRVLRSARKCPTCGPALWREPTKAEIEEEARLNAEAEKTMRSIKGAALTRSRQS
jgi:hypothetical protein